MARAKKSTKDNAPLVRSGAFFDTFDQLQKKIRRRAFEIFERRDDHEGDAMSDWLTAESNVLTSTALEMQEDDEAYVLTGELPEAFEAEEIDIDVSDGMLSVGGTHRTESSKKKGKSQQTSRSEISFMQRMTLPEDADVDHVDTEYKKGKLKVRFPKSRS